MARNKTIDLKNHLFAQLERLNDEELTKEQLEIEVEKSRALEGIARQIIDVEKIEYENRKLLLTAIDKNLIVTKNETINNILCIDNE